MKKKMMKILCLLLAVAMMLCAVSCKETTTDELSSQPQKPSEVATPNDDVSSDDDSDFQSEIEGTDIGVDIPNIDSGEVGFYLPYTSYFTQSVLDGDEIDEDDMFIEEDIEDIDDGLVFGEVENPIQMYGEPVKGSNRVFNVETDSVVYDNFVGHGSNVFPVQFMPEAKERYPFLTDVMFEVERDRWFAIKGHMYRCWFQVDWITTTDEANPTRKDYENNVDYQNYKKGIYDFDSERMKDVYPYFDTWKAAGSEIAINFGWKASTDIQTWFCFPGLPDPQCSAPLELDPFGRAAATTIKELRNNRGYDNITMLCFYNEPGHDYDFVTYLHTQTYWVLMLQYTNKWLDKLGIQDDIQVWSCGENSMTATHYEFTAAVKELGADEFDIYDGHYYYGRIKAMYDNNYEYAFKLFAFFREYFNEHVFYITENYCGNYENGPENHVEGDNWTGIYYWWNDSTASFVIAGANTGMRALLNWGYTGGCLPNPQFFNAAGGGYGCSWYSVDSQINLERYAQLFFYETALITNYIPAHSDVLQVDWTGDDIRGSAFKNPDGGYSILVEANGHEAETDGTEWDINATKRNLTINLKGNKKKLKFYKYRYNNDDAIIYRDARATIPTHVEVIEATSKIVDEIDETHAVYIYTTVAPTKQVEIKSDNGKINHFVKPDGTLSLEAKLIDCAANDEIVWSVSATSYKDGYNGTMTGYDGDMSNPNIFGTGKTATYTAPSASEVEAGDQIAIRASLKSNPNVFDVVVVQILDN